MTDKIKKPKQKLEQDYSGKVKCVFIDPPYNTGGKFGHYDLFIKMQNDRARPREIDGLGI